MLLRAIELLFGFTARVLLCQHLLHVCARLFKGGLQALLVCTRGVAVGLAAWVQSNDECMRPPLRTVVAPFPL